MSSLVSTRRRATVVVTLSLGLVLGTVAPVTAEVLGGVEGATLGREPLVTPTDDSADTPDDLQYADPTAGLTGIDPPEADASGAAQLSYPLVLPQSRVTPDLALRYDSGSASGWVGQGWSLGVGEVSVDTAFGVPKFCPRTTAPACGDYESESYRLDGDLLSPNAITADPQPRVTDRQDYTRQVETDYEKIVRHGSNPRNYSWEVRDKTGNVRWYGMFPDSGGPLGSPGTRTGPARNDLSRDPGSILSDDSGNGVTWYLKASRDIGYNMTRYEYDQVTYQAEETDHGTTWKKVETCDGVCARHVYLAKIFYTGAAEDSGEPEDPAYEVRMVRGKTRPDPVLDAGAGVLDLDKELLTRIEVRYAKTDELISQYRLSYDTNRFGKTLLTAVRQVGCADGGCDDGDATGAPGATHRFDYYDDVADPARGNGDGFAGAVTWDTRGDDLGSQPGAIENKASALGMSSTVGGDGHLYVGFNPTDPTKLGSFGGSVTLDGAGTTSLAEFMDLNGDNLPDKVFKDGTDIYLRLNTTKASGPLDQSVTFGDKLEVRHLSSLPGEHEFGVDGGVDLNYGVSVSFHAGGSWNWSDGYFSDVNGDGLPDYVNAGTVLYNHLDCSGEPCRPTFGTSDAETRLPLDVRDAGAGYTSTLTETLARLRRLSPPIDTVRRWVAPYAGTVTIDSRAVLVSPEQASTRLAIQRDGIELASGSLDEAGQAWEQELTDVTVAKGSRIYFRFSPDTTKQDSEVDWTPTVRYTGFANGPGDVPADENGLSQRRYDAGADFTLAGRPGGFVGMPSAGTVRFTGRLHKEVTSDDVRPTITHRSGDPGVGVVDEDVTVTALTPEGAPDPDRQKSVTESGGDFCVTTGAGTSFGCYPTRAAATAQLAVITTAETGLFEVTAAGFHVGGVTTGDDPRQDTVETRLAVDSPIDATALRWVTTPRLCYVEDGACDPSRPDVVPSVDTDVYPVTSADRPRQPWPAPAGNAVARIVLSGGDNPAGDLVFTAKKEGPGGVARVVAKKRIHLSGGTLPTHPAFFADVPLEAGSGYWFDVSTRDPSLSEVISGVDVRLGTGSGASWAEGADVPEQLDATGRQGYFAVPYRGWATAGYRGDGARRTSPLDEDRFRLSEADGSGYDDSDDACKAANDGSCPSSASAATFPGSYDEDAPAFDEQAMDRQIRQAYAFLPSRTTPEDDPDGPVAEAWTGPRPGIRSTATGLGAGLLGDEIPAVDTSTGTVPAPILTGTSGPVFALTGGVGPVTGSFGFGWSHSDVDYLDMNGDGFPDLVTPGSTTFTDPRGGMACPQSGGTLTACRGDGPDVVNFDTSFAFSGGFTGSPVNIKVNSRGVPSSTRGGSSAKGGGSSKDEYGVGLGAGAELAASFSSPNAASPSWNDSGFDVDLSKIPGDPLGKIGIPLQQSVADINGDGLPDKIKVMTDGVHVRLNLGYTFAGDVLWADGGFSSSASLTGALSLGLGFAGYNKDFSGGVSRNASVDFPLYSWDDVNGDGILDALYKAPDGKVVVAFGTGTGVRDGDSYGDTEEMSFQVLGDDDLLDLQAGDTIRQDSSIGYGGGADFTMGFGPLCSPVPACYLIVNPGAHAEGSASITDVDLQDVNGDGYADSVGRNPGAGDGELDVRLNTHGRTGLLKAVHNPLGGTIDLDYDRDGNTVAHPDSSWVLSKVSVDDGRTGDGPDVATSTIEYGGGRYDFVHRSDLGFRTVTVREHGAGGDGVLRTTRRTFSNHDVFDAGLLTKVELFAGDEDPANLVQQTVSTWRVLDGATGDPLDTDAMDTDEQLAAWATPLLGSTEERWYVAGDDTVRLTSRVEYAYDALGNPVTVTDLGDPTTDSDDVVSELTYSTCRRSAGEYTIDACGQGDPADHPPYWDDQLCPSWVSIPASIEVRDGAGTLLRYREGPESLCDNASVTDLRELISGTPADGTWARTRLAYDTWGSYDRIVYPEGADGLSYAVQYVRDEQRHADVAEVTDYELDADEAADFVGDQELTIAPEHVGLTSVSTFDPLSAEIATRTDANGSTTSYWHDALGRLTRVRTPDGGGVSYEYHPEAAGYAYAMAHHVDRFHPGDTIDTVAFVDGVGRTTQQKRESSLFTAVGQPTQDRFTVSGAVEYDVLGREVKQWYPISGALADAATYDPRTSEVAPTVRTYDVRDRVLTEKAPNQAVTSTAYGFAEIGGLHLATTTVTDPQGRAGRTLLDTRGYTHAVDDLAVGKAPLRTSYRVDPLGQLRTVVAAGRTQAAHDYDLLGRRTSTSTQDAGRVEYGYDAVGNKVSSQSSVQRADHDVRTRYSYAFGNLVGIDYPDATPNVTLTWGGYGGAPSGQNGAGRLVEVTDAARHQVLGYDANGLPARETTEMVDDHWKLGKLTTTFSYDWLGRLGSVGEYDGETIAYDYDHGGSLAGISGSKDCTDLGTLAAAAAAGATTLTVRENPLAADPALPFTITVGGEPVRVTARTPGAGGTTTYVVDPTTVAHGTGSKVTSAEAVSCRYRYLDTRQYDQFGQQAVQQTGNGVRTRQVRDAETRRLSRIRSVNTQAGDRELQDLAYRYDLVGNVLGVANELPADTSALMGGPSEQSYRYDPYYRVVHAEGAWHEAPDVRRQYSYDLSYDDATGNVTSKKQKVWEVKDSCTSKCKEWVDTDRTFDLGGYGYAGEQHRAVALGAGKSAQRLTYDLDGNITSIRTPDYLRQMTWDANGRMTSIVDRPNGSGGKPTTYAYDWQGQRATEVKETGRTWFVNPWLTVRDGTVWKNVVADGRMLATKFEQDDAYEAKAYFHHADLQGSTNVVTDRTGEVFQHQEYLPGGSVWVDEKSTIFRTPYQFGGEYADEDHGLTDLGQRWYDPSRAMVYGADPAVFADPAALVEEPTLAAPYTFARSNPLSWTDPDGARATAVNPAKVRALEDKLRNEDGTPLSLEQRIRLKLYFDQHQGLGGRLSYGILNHLEGLRKAHKVAEKFEMKPLLEISIGKGEDGGYEVKNVKLSWGYGKRAKLNFAGEEPGGNIRPPEPAANVPPAPPPPPAHWRPNQAGPAQQAAEPPVVAGAAPAQSDGG
ncbi:MAG: hypothetical protein J7518_22970 [Nocardioidaceae bacterium]|nr:hypothetical protein [Nocardioidaceae bacterium]